MASPPNVVDPDNVPGLMNPIMKRYQLQPKDIKEDRRNQDVPGKGEFFCGGCCYKWLSHFSWITLDLFDQRVAYRWSMKCKNCLTLCKPTFSIPEMQKLIEKAVCLYKGERFEGRGAKKGKIREFFVFTPPHCSMYCEKCGWGTPGHVQCWSQWRNRKTA